MNMPLKPKHLPKEKPLRPGRFSGAYRKLERAAVHEVDGSRCVEETALLKYSKSKKRNHTENIDAICYHNIFQNF